MVHCFFRLGVQVRVHYFCYETSCLHVSFSSDCGTLHVAVISSVRLPAVSTSSQALARVASNPVQSKLTLRLMVMSCSSRETYMCADHLWRGARSLAAESTLPPTWCRLHVLPLRDATSEMSEHGPRSRYRPSRGSWMGESAASHTHAAYNIRVEFSLVNSEDVHAASSDRP